MIINKVNTLHRIKLGTRNQWLHSTAIQQIKSVISMFERIKFYVKNLIIIIYFQWSNL